MLLESFKITGAAMIQIFILGVIGYFLVKKNVLGNACLDSISRLTLEITLPLLIFCQLIKEFSFSLYPKWWIFPILSLIITGIGLVVGGVFSCFMRGRQQKIQFISLIGFQNAGYLPLALIAALLPQQQADTMFVYLFLFLLGFNLVMFSLGVYVLIFNKGEKFEWLSLFNAPVLATIVALIFVLFGLAQAVPGFIYKPLKIVGDCTLPLAIFVVGGNIAQIRLEHIDKKAMGLVVLAKLIILPLLGLCFVIGFKIPELIGLLIVIQLAMPPAANLSVIIRQYKRDDLLISQGLFFGHVLSILTIPVFLTLFFAYRIIR